MKWTLHPAGAFEIHAEEWQRLNAASADTALLHPDFVGPLLREFPEAGMRLAVGEEGGVVRAMSVVARANPVGWSTLQPSQAPIGLVVADPSADRPALWRSLLRRLPGLPLLLSVTQQDPQFSPRPPDDGTLRTLDYIETARIAVEGTFEEYWKSRGRNLRRNIDRQRNRLAREGIEPRLETLTEAADMDRAVEDYGRLESAGWKAERGTAIAPDNDQGRFYRAVLKSFAARGETRVDRLFYGDRLVACDLSLWRKGVLIVLKTTYDESQTTSSPALQMRYLSFQEVFADPAARAIEFYGRVMDWHRKWSDDIRTLYHVTCARWPAVWALRSLLQRLQPSRSVPPAPLPAEEPGAKETGAPQGTPVA